MKVRNDLPDEIREADALLEQADRSASAENRAKALTDGLDALADYARLNPSSPHLKYVSNRKRAHARRLLIAISSGGHHDLEDYWHLFSVAVTKLLPEINDIAASDPKLSDAWHVFRKSHAAELRKILGRG